MPSTTEISIWNIEHKRDTYTRIYWKINQIRYEITQVLLWLSRHLSGCHQGTRRSINRSRRTHRGDLFAWRDRSIASNGKHCLANVYTLVSAVNVLNTNLVYVYTLIFVCVLIFWNYSKSWLIYVYTLKYVYTLIYVYILVYVCNLGIRIPHSWWYTYTTLMKI